MKHSIKAMKASPTEGKGCSIVVCGSQLGLDGECIGSVNAGFAVHLQWHATGHPNLTAYCASKFAVRGITQSAAAELGSCGIRVNTVCPGRKLLVTDIAWNRRLKI